MSVDYDKIANSFSDSRKKMKWEEIDYFISTYMKEFEWKNILDIWCGSARLLEQISNTIDISKINYLWLDLSEGMLKHAKNNFPEKEFKMLNMLDINKLEWKKFDFIFFIASFHHLEDLEQRLDVIKKAKKLLNDDWIIFITNWSLDSEVNHDKYIVDLVDNSINDFWGTDYKIYFWKYSRYYHCFTLNELEYIFTENNFKIIENREFDTKKNFISVIKK